PNPLHLCRGLPAAQRVDDRPRGDEAIRKRGLREGLLELEPETMRETVRGRVALRVVERDRPRRQALDGLAEGGLDALVVADHVVAARLLDGGRVEATDDRDALTRGRDDEGARPGAVR